MIKRFYFKYNLHTNTWMQTIKKPHRRLLIKMTTIDIDEYLIEKNCLCIIKLCIKAQILKNVNYVEINVRFYKQLVEFVFVFLEIYGLIHLIHLKWTRH